MSLAISARNFGPIAKGTVRLGPATIFIGPNNSGKSFFSTLIYAALWTQKDHYFPVPGRILETRRINQPIVDELAAEIAARARREKDFNADRWRPSEKESDLIKRLVHAELTAYARGVCRELERCLGAPLPELVSVRGVKAGRMEFILHEDEASWRIRITCDADDDSETRNEPNIDIPKIPSMRRLIRHINRLTRYEQLVLDIDLFAEQDRNVRAIELGKSLALRAFMGVREFLFQAFPTGRYYLPAARSGIMQSHKALAAMFVGSAPLVGLRRMEFPQISGIVTDFIIHLLGMDPLPAARRRASSRWGEDKSSKRVEDIALFIEREVLHGRIVTRKAEEPYPEIFYRSGRLEVPMVRISSMISELAPVVLYLRHVLSKGDYLIIEEPEAHLHPVGQREVARALAGLSSAVSLTITTHSDYFLSEINNILRQSVLSDGSGPFHLHPDAVAAYLFRPDPSSGTVIERLEVTLAEGIPDEEFARVAESIYNEATELEYRILEAGEPRDVD